MSYDLRIFNFEGHVVRIILIDDEPWWVVADLCSILWLLGTKEAIEDLDEDEKRLHLISDHGREIMISIISASGLYTLIMKSLNPNAKNFRKWIKTEVLPQIKSTGSYNILPDKDEKERIKLAEERAATRHRILNAELAKILQRIIENPAYELTAESKKILVHEITTLITGKEYPEMLPKRQHNKYTWLNPSESSYSNHECPQCFYRGGEVQDDK